MAGFKNLDDFHLLFASVSLLLSQYLIFSYAFVCSLLKNKSFTHQNKFL